MGRFSVGFIHEVIRNEENEIIDRILYLVTKDAKHDTTIIIPFSEHDQTVLYKGTKLFHCVFMIFRRDEKKIE